MARVIGLPTDSGMAALRPLASRAPGPSTSGATWCNTPTALSWKWSGAGGHVPARAPADLRAPLSPCGARSLHQEHGDGRPVRGHQRHARRRHGAQRDARVQIGAGTARPGTETYRAGRTNYGSGQQASDRAGRPVVRSCYRSVPAPSRRTRVRRQGGGPSPARSSATRPSHPVLRHAPCRAPSSAGDVRTRCRPPCAGAPRSRAAPPPRARVR